LQKRWPRVICVLRLLSLALLAAMAAISLPAADEFQGLPQVGYSQAASSAIAPAQSSRLPSQPPEPPAQSLPANPLGDAKALVRKGDFDAAIGKYQQLLHERPNSPDAFAGLARVYLKKNDVAQAYETVTTGLRVTDSWPVRVALGEVYFRQGKIPEAEKEWVDVINSGHQAPRAYLGLARVRWAISMRKSARAMIEKAHELDPKDPDIEQRWLGTLSRRERIEHLENDLAASSPDDAARPDMQHHLELLKATAGSDQSCALVSTVASTETPMIRMLIDPQHLRGYGLSVGVNGAKIKLLLDTGSSGILMDRGMAERAGVTKIAETRIAGIGDQGSKAGYVALASSIRIGDLEFRDCPVRVVESRSVVGQDGLIGADVFEDFLVDIDFPTEKLRLHGLPKRPNETTNPKITLNVGDKDGDLEKSDEEPAPNLEETKSTPPNPSGPEDRYISPEMKSYTSIYRFGHDLLIPTKIGDKPAKLFLLDTGSVGNMISADAAREITKVDRDSHAVLKGLSGSVTKVYTARKAVLQFGHLRQENQEMLAFDLSSISNHAGTEVSGTLGFAMLHLLEIKIDYRDGLVDFTYDPQRSLHF